MKLCELSDGYKEAAKSVNKQIAQLRKAMKATNDPQERSALQYRLAQLYAILTQCNELQELTEHYYERGYIRNDKYIL